ncbi:MAG: hypothetical protein ACE5LV_01735 [Candidatus Aminicenantales bacterium]
MRETNLKSNVHFWLRKISLFVWCVDQTEVDIPSCLEKKGRMEEEPKGEGEIELRRRLSKMGVLGPSPPEKLTREEALEACVELFRILMEPFEPEVQGFIKDPRCPGGLPKDFIGR